MGLILLYAYNYRLIFPTLVGLYRFLNDFLMLMGLLRDGLFLFRKVHMFLTLVGLIHPLTY